jgi:CubicO group peptidase (beta-lactamase class C family)
MLGEGARAARGAAAIDPLQLITRLEVPILSRCRVPSDLEPVTSIAEEVPPRKVGLPTYAIDRVWRAAVSLYRTGVHPAIQICLIRRGKVVLHRAIGHAAGNAPDDPPGAKQVPVTTETPFNIFSASKAITAMVIHKLDEMGVLHLEARVCEFIPEFASHGKDRISIRHILAHRAGIPNLPPEAIDLDLLTRPDKVVEILCDARPSSRPGRLLAYHAVSGGFVLGEVVRRATGQDIRAALERLVVEPLGFRWMNYGVKPDDVSCVARSAFTGPPVPPPISGILRRALGVDLRRAVDLSNDPRFMTGIIPSANVITTARELAAFYQCLLQEGELDGVRVFDPRTVRHATSEQSFWEIDFTLGLPLRYGLGFMLGGEHLSIYGLDNPQAFGHVGFTNMFSWADPERELVVALLTSGKPIVSLHVIRLLKLLFEINRAFPKLTDRERTLHGAGQKRAAPVSATGS